MHASAISTVAVSLSSRDGVPRSGGSGRVYTLPQRIRRVSAIEVASLESPRSQLLVETTQAPGATRPQNEFAYDDGLRIDCTPDLAVVPDNALSNNQLFLVDMAAGAAPTPADFYTLTDAVRERMHRIVVPAYVNGCVGYDPATQETETAKTEAPHGVAAYAAFHAAQGASFPELPEIRTVLNATTVSLTTDVSLVGHGAVLDTAATLDYDADLGRFLQVAGGAVLNSDDDTGAVFNEGGTPNRGFFALHCPPLHHEEMAALITFLLRRPSPTNTTGGERTPTRTWTCAFVDDHYELSCGGEAETWAAPSTLVFPNVGGRGLGAVLGFSSGQRAAWDHARYKWVLAGRPVRCFTVAVDAGDYTATGLAQRVAEYANVGTAHPGRKPFYVRGKSTWSPFLFGVSTCAESLVFGVRPGVYRSPTVFAAAVTQALGGVVTGVACAYDEADRTFTFSGDDPFTLSFDAASVAPAVGTQGEYYGTQIRRLARALGFEGRSYELRSSYTGAPVQWPAKETTHLTWTCPSAAEHQYSRCDLRLLDGATPDSTFVIEAMDPTAVEGPQDEAGVDRVVAAVLAKCDDWHAVEFSVNTASDMGTMAQPGVDATTVAPLGILPGDTMQFMLDDNRCFTAVVVEAVTPADPGPQANRIIRALVSKEAHDLVDGGDNVVRFFRAADPPRAQFFPERRGMSVPRRLGLRGYAGASRGLTLPAQWDVVPYPYLVVRVTTSGGDASTFNYHVFDGRGSAVTARLGLGVGYEFGQNPSRAATGAIQDVERLTVELLNPDGTPYEHHGRDFYFTLLFTTVRGDRVTFSG